MTPTETASEPEGPRVVTSTRRRGARRAAGPPPAATATGGTTVLGAGAQAGPAAEPADIPVDPGGAAQLPTYEDGEQPDSEGDEDGTSGGLSVLHVPVKRKGARKR